MCYSNDNGTVPSEYLKRIENHDKRFISTFEGIYIQGRTESTIAGRERNWSKYRPSEQDQVLWTTEEHEYLVELLRTKNIWHELHGERHENLEKERSLRSLQDYPFKHELEAPIVRAPPPWTDEQYKYLGPLYITEWLNQRGLPTAQFYPLRKQRRNISENPWFQL